MQLAGVGADHLGEVRDDHRLGVHDGVAERLGLGAVGAVHPERGQPVSRLGGGDALQAAGSVPGVHREQVPGHDPCARDLGAAHLEHVLVGLQAELVVDAHRGDHDPELPGDLAADHRDAPQ